MKATFRVENIDALEPGAPLDAVFSQLGGFIGSGPDNTWQIQDIDNGIVETAARIVTQGPHFTIEALNGMEIRINEARSPIAAGRAVILSDKDRLEIGALRVLLSLPTGNAAEDDTAYRTVSRLIGDKNVDDALVINGTLEHASDHEPELVGGQVAEPLEALERASRSARPTDPVAAFDAMKRARAPENTAEVLAQTRTPAQDQSPEPTGDQSDWHFSAMPTPRIERDEFGFEDEGLDSAAQGAADFDAATLDLGGPVDHIALRPLSRALGIQLGDMPTDEANRVLSEIGDALRRALDGLNKIYRTNNRRHGHFQLSKMHLHALDDNPIQFSEGVDEALHAFFSKRGPVHLSAPAAFEETIEHLQSHQSATEHAIDEALDTVMTALTPQALQKRFRAYESEPHGADRDQIDAWCWRMYRAYFNELRSERQRGLQMLFWEVFAQEYQQDMRRRERERYLSTDEAD